MISTDYLIDQIPAHLDPNDLASLSIKPHSPPLRPCLDHIRVSLIDTIMIALSDPHSDLSLHHHVHQLLVCFRLPCECLAIKVCNVQEI
jgi:hypothetical protein